MKEDLDESIRFFQEDRIEKVLTYLRQENEEYKIIEDKRSVILNKIKYSPLDDELIAEFDEYEIKMIWIVSIELYKAGFYDGINLDKIIKEMKK